MAKTSPGEFIRQVRTEATKVVWPTRKETGMTTVMVLIMALVLGIFFFVVDLAFSQIVKFLLSLISG
ncbi:preprotein translocase subunit SecE [Aquisediminimonas sediminicola]|uniref:preprotein translocase subunit SecE n=1 Tax=Alteraquisediminimonas sediminicola TaxID=2676787 RepID=UPI001C8E136D